MDAQPYSAFSLMILNQCSSINGGGSAAQAFGVPLVSWMPLSYGQPRADVMAQSQELILSL
jgi:hypothetical protein